MPFPIRGVKNKRCEIYVKSESAYVVIDSRVSGVNGMNGDISEAF